MFDRTVVEIDYFRSNCRQEAAQVLGFSFSSEVLGFSSKVLGFSSEVLGFSSEVLGFSSAVLGFSRETVRSWPLGLGALSSVQRHRNLLLALEPLDQGSWALALASWAWASALESCALARGSWALAWGQGL